VITTLNDLGVAVYEQTPDAEALIITDNAPAGATEEEAEEAAEAALSTVDSEFGRTTDPVRMYMREMGTVELLTREGEIEIAKRIEGGLMAMMEAISASPATIAEILNMGEDIREGKVVISTIVDGFSNPNEADDYVAEEDFDEYDEADDDDGKGGSKALTKKLEKLKNEALERFDKHARAVREGAQDLRQGRLRHACLHEGAGRPVRRADDHPLHGQDHREAVRHGARPGGRCAQEGARAAPHHRGQVRHAPGDLHQGLPAQPAEPAVGRKAGRRGKPWSAVMGATFRPSRSCSKS
jgi:hypothetical protein